MDQGQQGSVWWLVLFGIVFVAIGALLIVQKIKRKKAQWTGVVIDKSMNEHVQSSARDRDAIGNSGFSIGLGRNNAVKRSYSLRIRDDSGKEFSWPVGEGMYMSVNVGFRLQKQPGTETPTIVEQSGGVGSVTTHATQANNLVQPQPTGIVQNAPVVPGVGLQNDQTPQPPQL